VVTADVVRGKVLKAGIGGDAAAVPPEPVGEGAMRFDEEGEQVGDGDEPVRCHRGYEQRRSPVHRARPVGHDDVAVGRDRDLEGRMPVQAATRGRPAVHGVSRADGEDHACTIFRFGCRPGPVDCHNSAMSRTLKVALAAGLAGLGLAGLVVVLVNQGLDRAEKWTSLVGMFVSAGIGALGVFLAWRTLRGTSAGAGSGRVSRTGKATASGPGSVAVSGSLGSSPGTVVNRTGEATARDGGLAVSGDDGRSSRPSGAEDR
jgi:hypothetical protein